MIVFRTAVSSRLARFARRLARLQTLVRVSPRYRHRPAPPTRVAASTPSPLLRSLLVVLLLLMLLLLLLLLLQGRRGRCRERHGRRHPHRLQRRQHRHHRALGRRRRLIAAPAVVMIAIHRRRSLGWVHDLESENHHVHLRPALPPHAQRLRCARVHLALDSERVPEIAPPVPRVGVEACLDLGEVVHREHDALVEQREVLRQLGV